MSRRYPKRTARFIACDKKVRTQTPGGIYITLPCVYSSGHAKDCLPMIDDSLRAVMAEADKVAELKK